MTRNVIIIGGGIAGLTATALLAKNELDVTLVEKGSFLGGFSSYFNNKHGYHFDIGTDILPGFGQGEVFHWLFKELDLGDPLDPKKGIVDPISTPQQVILPEHRINILSNRADMAAELEREFPGKSKQIISIYEKIDRLEGLIFKSMPDRHPYSMSDRYGHKKKLEILQSNSKLRALFNAELTLAELIEKQPQPIRDFFGIQTFPLMNYSEQTLAMTVAAVLIGKTKRGYYKIRGGYNTLVDKLSRAITNRGGKILTGTNCENIIVRKNRACGIKAKQGNNSIELAADYVLAPFPFYQISSKYFQKGILSNYLAKKSRPPRMETFVPFTLLLGVDSDVIPEPMNERVLVKDPTGENELLHIHLNNNNDPKMTPIGKKTITVTVWISKKAGEQMNEEGKEKKKKNIIDALEGCIPFLSEHIYSCDIVDQIAYKTISGKEGVSKYLGSRHLYRLPKLQPKTPVAGLYTIDDSSPLFYSSPSTAKAAIYAAESIIKRG